MTHKTKVKMAKGMLSYLERVNNISIFNSVAWKRRNINRRIKEFKKREARIKKEALLKKESHKD